MAVGERVGQVDIRFAHDAKRRRVDLAHDGHRSLLAEACFSCFALCFNFLSFDFFGANKRGREWWERHSVEGVKGRGTVEITKWSDTQLRHRTHKKVEIFE